MVGTSSRPRTFPAPARFSQRTAVLGCGPDDAVLPDPIRVSVSKLLARSGATPVCMHGPESVAPTAPMTGKESTGSADERAFGGWLAGRRLQPGWDSVAQRSRRLEAGRACPAVLVVPDGVVATGVHRIAGAPDDADLVLAVVAPGGHA